MTVETDEAPTQQPEPCLPSILDNDEARRLLRLAQQAGWLDKAFQPSDTLSCTEVALLSKTRWPSSEGGGKKPIYTNIATAPWVNKRQMPSSTALPRCWTARITNLFSVFKPLLSALLSALCPHFVRRSGCTFAVELQFKQ